MVKSLINALLLTLPCLSHSKDTHTKLIKVGLSLHTGRGFKAKGVFMQHTNYVMGVAVELELRETNKMSQGKESNTNHKTHLFMVHSLPSIYSPLLAFSLVLFLVSHYKKLLPLGWSSSLEGGEGGSNIFH